MERFGKKKYSRAVVNFSDYHSLRLFTHLDEDPHGRPQTKKFPRGELASSLDTNSLSTEAMSDLNFLQSFILRYLSLKSNNSDDLHSTNKIEEPTTLQTPFSTPTDVSQALKISPWPGPQFYQSPCVMAEDEASKDEIVVGPSVPLESEDLIDPVFSSPTYMSIPKGLAALANQKKELRTQGGTAEEPVGPLEESSSVSDLIELMRQKPYGDRLPAHMQERINEVSSPVYIALSNSKYLRGLLLIQDSSLCKYACFREHQFRNHVCLPMRHSSLS